MFLIILLVIEEEVLVVMFIHIRLIHFIDLFLIIKDFLAWPHVQMGLMMYSLDDKLSGMLSPNWCSRFVSSKQDLR